MELFFELEIVYIVIGTFILSVTAIVTTRDFVAYREIKDTDGNVVDKVPTHTFKKGFSMVGAFVAIMIGLHYNTTTSRMAETEKIFHEGATIICENKKRRSVSRSVLLTKDQGWRLEDYLFKHDDYERDFHTSRCINWIGSQPQIDSEKIDRFKLDKDKK